MVLLFPFLMVFVGLFYTCTKKHVVVEHLPQAQHSAISSPSQSGKASTCRSERDNASRQTELARASMSSSIYAARCVLKTNHRMRFDNVCSILKLYTCKCDGDRMYLLANTAYNVRRQKHGGCHKGHSLRRWCCCTAAVVPLLFL